MKAESNPLPRLAPRRPDSHKGDYGRVLLMGGSRGMAGAIGMAGMAALRGGAGLVTLAVPDVVLDVVASYEPALMTAPLPSDADGRLTVAAKDRVVELADQATAVACGPGLGRSPQITELIAWMYSVLPRPLVLDADALFALAQQPDCLVEPGGVRVCTPHPGEFRRLVGRDFESREHSEELAREWAATHGVVLVLKGHRTLVTDGQQSFHNSTGNPGMATGGSGDVLTGLVAALLGQGLSPLDAARLGVHVHGLAGDLAAAELGQVALIATDLIRYLPRAWLQLERG